MKKNKNTKRVAIIGIGRVGLPLALVFANMNFQVFGIGKDPQKVELINTGKMPFMENGAQKLLNEVIGKNFIATCDYSYIKKCDYIILTLGTPIDENMNPVFEQIENSVYTMKPFFKPGQTLILRSTVSPGTTQYVCSIIKGINNLKVGKNFFISFCPERISEGKSIDEIKSLPQIIGGVDKRSSKKAKELFNCIGIETLVTDDVSAELAKLFTNMYRYINFAIANEFMILAQNFHKDIYEIVNLVNYHYERGGLKLPGLSAGPCLFKDGFFLINDLPFTDLISTSWKINEAIPIFLVKKIREKMRLEGKKAVVLGLGFKADSDDIRESLSFKVRKALFRERARVTVHDPYIKDYKYQDIEPDLNNAIKHADLIFVATNHKQYKKLNVKKMMNHVNKDCIICDIWNVFATDKVIFSLKDFVNKNRID